MSKLLNDIKQRDKRYEGIILDSAEYSKFQKVLKLSFVLSVHFDAFDVKEITKVVNKNLPFATAEIELKKLVCDCELLSRKIIEFISENYRVLKDRVTCKDICTERLRNKKLKYSHRKII